MVRYRGIGYKRRCWTQSVIRTREGAGNTSLQTLTFHAFPLSSSNMAVQRKERYCCHPKQYDDYYTNQMGHGMPVFTGARLQRGHGLGNVLSSVLRMAMPLVKSGAKTLARQGLKTGLKVAGDVMRGRKPRQAVRQQAKRAGQQLLSTGLQRIMTEQFPQGTPAGRGRCRNTIKRCASTRGVSSSRVKRARMSKDIFG